jgi:hypothetical protein
MALLPTRYLSFSQLEGTVNEETLDEHLTFFDAAHKVHAQAKKLLAEIGKSLETCEKACAPFSAKMAERLKFFTMDVKTNQQVEGAKADKAVLQTKRVKLVGPADETISSFEACLATRCYTYLKEKDQLPTLAPLFWYLNSDSYSSTIEQYRAFRGTKKAEALPPKTKERWKLVHGEKDSKDSKEEVSHKTPELTPLSFYGEARTDMQACDGIVGELQTQLIRITARLREADDSPKRMGKAHLDGFMELYDSAKASAEKAEALLPKLEAKMKQAQQFSAPLETNEEEQLIFLGVHFEFNERTKKTKTNACQLEESFTALRAAKGAHASKLQQLTQQVTEHFNNYLIEKDPSWKNHAAPPLFGTLLERYRALHALSKK